MSAAAVQRVVVRMMFDPSFRAAVYAEPARALAGADVTAEERAWLVRPDPRAYATDGTRAARALLALTEELPAATAWARAEGRDPEAFFTSPALHACVEERGVLVYAYAAWLAEGASAPLAQLVALEAAVARARRGRVEPDPRGDGLVLGPRAALLPTPDGALAWWHAVREAATLGRPLPVPALSGVHDVLIIVADDGATSAEVLAEGLAALLEQARAPVARAALEAHAAALGLTAEEAAEIVDGLVVDRVLVPAPLPGP